MQCDVTSVHLSPPELCSSTHRGSDFDPTSLSSRSEQETVSSTFETQSAIWGEGQRNTFRTGFLSDHNNQNTVSIIDCIVGEQQALNSWQDFNWDTSPMTETKAWSQQPYHLCTDWIWDTACSPTQAKLHLAASNSKNNNCNQQKPTFTANFLFQVLRPILKPSSVLMFLWTSVCTKTIHISGFSIAPQKCGDKPTLVG